MPSRLLPGATAGMGANLFASGRLKPPPQVLSRRFNSTIGAAAEAQGLLFKCVDLAKLLCRPQIGYHQGKGFLRAMFVQSEAFDGLLIACINQQLVAAYAFNGNDFAVLQLPDCFT